MFDGLIRALIYVTSHTSGTDNGIQLTAVHRPGPPRIVVRNRGGAGLHDCCNKGPRFARTRLNLQP